MSALELDRREFVSGLAAAAAGVALWPAPSLVSAVPVSSAVTGPELADWHIDDICCAYPRYAEPIGYGRPVAEQGSAEPLDAL